MAKKEAFNPIKWERRQQRRLNARGKAIKELFDNLAQRASLLGIDVKLPSDKDFEFKNYPALEKRVDELVKEVSQKVTRIIEDGEEEAWIEANAKNDALVDSVVKGFGLPKEVVAQWKQPNLSALAAFQARKIAGMGLSQRVWKLTQTAKQELELALDLGIGEGKSAAELSRDIRKYLNEPNKLFRRVRDEKGILRLSKAAKMYHPGRGVYRSSYKNALRLTQTEINMAYRSSDHERWSQIDWIIGVRVSLSNNHTLNGLPFHDICDDVQGVYPKDWKHLGWHPKCRCYATPVLAKREERIAYLKKMANGEDVSGYKFSGQTKEVPQGFKDWVDKNAERIKGAEERGKLPYFLRDNGKFLTHDKEGLMSVAPQVKTPLDIARERHAMRTQEQAKAIQDRWDAKLAQDNLTKKTANNVLNVAKEYPEVDIATLQQYIDTRNLKAMKKEARNVAKQVSAIKKDERFLEKLIPNVHEWKKQFTSEELHAVYDAVEKKLAQISSLSLEEQAKKLDFESKYVAAPSFFKPGAVQYPTWQVSQNAYLKQKARIVDEIEWKNINKSLQDAIEFDTKSKPYKELIVELQKAVAIKDKDKAQNILADLQVKRNKIEADRIARELKKTGVTPKTFSEMDEAEIDRLLSIYDKETFEQADKRLRGLSESVWENLTDEEKLILTKYTQTYHYLNEPLRGIPYYGSLTPNKDHVHDLPILTRALAKFRMPANTVVRRGTNDYAIKELGYNLSNVKAGDIFTDKGFLSTAVQRKKGFFMQYDLVICVPKGAQGYYVEPLSHYTDFHKFNYASKTLWDGKSVEVAGSEAEWIGQRGCKFKVIKKVGNTIFLQIIGQLQ